MMRTKFHHLYGDKFAAFLGDNKDPKILFPQFTPEESKEYPVEITVTNGKKENKRIYADPYFY